MTICVATFGGFLTLLFLCRIIYLCEHCEEKICRYDRWKMPYHCKCFKRSEHFTVEEGKSMDIRNDQKVIVYDECGAIIYKGAWEGTSEEVKSADYDWYMLADCEEMDIVVIL